MLSHLLLSSLAAGAAPAPEAAPAPADAVDQTRLIAPLVQDEEEEPMGVWTGSVNAGATWTSGNTEITTLSAAANASYREADYRHTLGAWWNYAEQENAAGESELTQRRIGGNYKYDYFVNDRLYYNGLFGIEADELANLDLRWYAGAGVGYVFYDEETMGLDGEVGLVYFSQEFETGDDEDYIAARIAYNYWNQINENVRFEQDMWAFPSVEDIEDFYGRLDSRLMIKMSEAMFAQIQHVFDYNNSPAPGAQRDDHRVIMGLGWNF